MRNAALPLAVLIAFRLYTIFVMAQAEQSLVQFGLQLMAAPDTAQVVIDLYILAALACVWMHRDNQARGRSLVAVLPYFALTAIFVSVGPLLYLVVRAFARQPQLSPSGERMR